MKLSRNQQNTNRRPLFWLGFLFLLLVGTYLWNSARVANNNNLSDGEYWKTWDSIFLYADLGGMPVAIPAYFANYAEYDGGPGWGEVPVEEKPARNADSRLRAFGFNVRYPDMVGGSTPALVLEKLKQPPGEKTWMSVTVTTGEFYPGDGFLDKWAHGVLDTPHTMLPVENYERLQDREYGLEVYAPAGIDPNTRLPFRQSLDAYDVFVQRNEAGKVKTVIRCSNRKVVAPPCNQFFSLEPKSQTNITVHYSRRLLEEWQGIQDSVSELIYSFEVKN